MRVLSHAHVLNAVVHTDGDDVLRTELDELGHIVAMGRGKTHLVTGLNAVHVDGSLDVRTFEEERDALVAPRLGHVDRAAVPGFAHVVAFGSEEEGELHLALVAVFLHVGVEVEARVVERTRPLGVHTHEVALAVGEHRAGQHHVVVVAGRVAHAEVPRAGQADDLLGTGHREAACRAGKGEESFHANDGVHACFLFYERNVRQKMPSRLTTSTLTTPSPGVLSASRGR